MSSMASTETPEARELSLVGKVELRIALTDTDTKLESMLKTYLAPLLLKLGSDHMSVRNKVISVCQHINTRIKAPSIKLPVATLLKQYKDTHNNLVRHFDLLYVQQGIDRLPTNERLELLPTIIHGLARNFLDSAAHTASLFNLLLKLLFHMKLPPRGSNEDIDLRTKLALDENPQDSEFITSWIGKLILFSTSATRTKNRPGLSVEDSDFLELYGKEDLWKPGTAGALNLTETKIVAVKFLASGAFLDSERFMPALFASADLNSRISDVGDDILKRATPMISLEDHFLIESLFSTYIGTRGQDGSLPARVPLQTKILALLCRSKEATGFVPQIIQIVKEGLIPDHQMTETTTGPQKQGLEAAKLRNQVFSFTNWMARTGSSESIGAVAPTLVNEIRAYIESQGWPQFNGSDSRTTSAELASRCYGYESIGLLARSCSQRLLLDPNLDLLRWLFNSLSGDASSKDVSISIEQALASVLGAFGGDIGVDLEAPLTGLLLDQMNLQIGEPDTNGNIVIRSTRYTAVRFANRCLPFSNTTARWIDILAIGKSSSERSEVVDEGRKGLDPHWYRNLNPLQHTHTRQLGDLQANNYTLPDFGSLVRQFFGSNAKATKPEWHQLTGGYGSAVLFCLYILLHQALTSKNKIPKIDIDWKRNIDAVVTNDEATRDDIRLYLREVSGSSMEANTALRTYIYAAFTGLVEQSHGDGGQIGDCLLEICSLSPDSALNDLSPNVDHLRSIIFSNKHTLRLTASHIFGLLASRKACPAEVRDGMLKDFQAKIEFWEQAVGSDVHQVHGSILATAFWLSRKKYRQRDQSIPTEWELRFLNSVMSILDSARDKDLLAAAIEAINQLSLFGFLTQHTMPASYGIIEMTTKLKQRAESGDEKAISALGHFAMQCDEDDPTLERIIDILYALHEQRQAEIQFAVGAALSCAAIGWHSKSSIGLLDIDGPSPNTRPRSSTLRAILEKVLSDCKTTKPSLRQGSVIWLLCVVQYCGHCEEVASQLRTCQVAFKGFLSDRDSLNQESASRGLTLIYEKGDRALKDDLVRDLVGSFTGSSAGLAGSVSNETQLFEPGALPTGDGSVTTYKDIVSLASEVGDSSLVYRFMSLASNNAIWSSRAAFGRFGLTDILSDSSVDGYLAQNPKLYPALYRYRFDPNTNVRTAMNDIWSALVKDSAATIDSYFELIMEDLLKNILGKEWRVREASCAAIADLVQGRPLKRYETYLTQIWTLTFKVCDDIKESVRTAAMALARVLTGVLTRSLEAGDASAASANTMLKEVLPFLLSPSGLESSAQEVQGFALKTLLQIIKSSNGKVLRPYVPELISRLLGLLSSLEPQAVNYIHLNADKYGMTTQQIDDVRLNSVKGSPMMEAIERCLDMLDERNMDTLGGKLGNAIKSAIGLPSKVGSSRIIVSLSTRHSVLFRPYADQFLRLLRRQVLDRNDTISTSFAVACGYLSRLASDEGLLELIIYCKKLYFDSEEDRHRAISGEIVFAVGKHATDHFAALAGDILPFIFIAKHDAFERARDSFTDTWNQNVGGSRAVMLYLKEIVTIGSPCLDSPSWSIKHTSAYAIADAVKSLGNEISIQNVDILWPTLEKAISGKTWEGKEIILEALVMFAKNSSVLATNQEVADQIQTIVFRESKRTNPSYRRYAFNCLGDFVDLRSRVDLFAQVYNIAEPIIRNILDDSNEMDIDSQSGGPSSKFISEETLANATRMLLKSLNPISLSEQELVTFLSQTLELVKKAMARKNRVVQDAILDGEKVLFQKLDVEGKALESLEDALAGYVPTLFETDDAVEQTRLKAVEAVSALISKARKGGALEALLRREIKAAKARERSFSVQQGLDRAEQLFGR